MTIEDNKRVLVEFDALLGADDLTSLDRLCRHDMVNHAIAATGPEVSLALESSLRRSGDAR